MAGNLGSEYNIYDTGMNKNLVRGAEDSLDIAFPELDAPNSVSQDPVSSIDSFSGGIVNSVAGTTSPSDLRSGEMPSLIGFGKKKFSDTTAGFLMGLDGETNIYKWIIGDSASSADWAVTTANTLTINGSLVAGSVGGWTITSGYIYSLSSGTPTVAPNAGIVMASTNPAIITYEGTAKRTEMGYLSAGVFGFKGYATNGTTVIFEISDTQQKIAGWNFTDTVLRSGATDAASNVLLDPTNSLLRLGPTTGNYLTLDGANLRIRSSNYVSGFAGAGFTLEPDLLEVGNIAARGLIRSSVMEYNNISVHSGSDLIAQGGDVLNADMTAADASTFTIKGTDTFAVNDRLRIKDGTNDEWLLVTSIASAPTYAVTRDQAGVYGADANPAWKKGASVINYGQSGAGLIYMTASDSNAPYLSVLTHAGSPWTTLTTQLRLGNLNGYLGYVADTFGLGVGSSSGTDSNITIDPTNGIRIRNGTTNKITFDNSGNATLLNLTVGGSLNVSTSGNIKSGQSAYNTGAGYFMEYNGGTPRLSIGDGTTTNSLTWDGSNLNVNGSPISNNDIYGDGSDGNVTISGDTSLTTDMYYNNLTIQTTKTLSPNGFRIFVKGILTFEGTGKIAAVGTAGGNGENASGIAGGNGGTAGAIAHSTGTLPAAEAGKVGGAGGWGTYASCNVGGAGTAGGGNTKVISGAGSAGGASSGGGNCDDGFGNGAAGGAAGAVSGTIFNLVKNSFAAYNLSDDYPSYTKFKTVCGSGSGGGGYSGMYNPATVGFYGAGGGGGGSGATGGFIWLSARKIITVNGNTYLDVHGSNGGNGGNGNYTGHVNAYGGAGGGGAGGRGGVIVLIYSSKTGTGTSNISGGTGGTKGNNGQGNPAGFNGSDGGTGVELNLIV